MIHLFWHINSVLQFSVQHWDTPTFFLTPHIQQDRVHACIVIYIYVHTIYICTHNTRGGCKTINDILRSAADKSPTTKWTRFTYLSPCVPSRSAAVREIIRGSCAAYIAFGISGRQILWKLPWNLDHALQEHVPTKCGNEGTKFVIWKLGPRSGPNVTELTFSLLRS